MNFNEDEFLICTIATLLSNSRHVAVGMASAIPGSASLLAREERRGQRNSLRVSMIGGDSNNPFTVLDVGVLLGIDYMYSEKISLNTRIRNSIIPIGKEDWIKTNTYNSTSKGKYNSVISFTINYNI